MGFSRAKCCIGDDLGNGHDINIYYQDDGSLIIESQNPDSLDQNVVTIVGNQPKLLLNFILKYFGSSLCNLKCGDGICAGDDKFKDNV